MKLLLKPFHYLYCIWALLSFIAIMLVILPFVFIASFFGHVRGGNMIIGLCRLWADTWFPVIGIWFRYIYEAPHDRKRPFIFVSNHISYLDAAILCKAFRQPFRPLAKAEMGKVPVFGYIYKNAVVSVQRDNPAHRAKSVRVLSSLTKKGISVLVFPEGTFNMGTKPLRDFYDGAFRVAIETQTPIKPVLFLDGYNRMHYGTVFSICPGPCRIVYLEEVPVAGMSAEDLPALKEKVYRIMEQKLREYKAAWIKD